MLDWSFVRAESPPCPSRTRSARSSSRTKRRIRALCRELPPEHSGNWSPCSTLLSLRQGPWDLRQPLLHPVPLRQRHQALHGLAQSIPPPHRAPPAYPPQFVPPRPLPARLFLHPNKLRLPSLAQLARCRQNSCCLRSQCRIRLPPPLGGRSRSVVAGARAEQECHAES